MNTTCLYICSPFTENIGLRRNQYSFYPTPITAPPNGKLYTVISYFDCEYVISCNDGCMGESMWSIPTCPLPINKKTLNSFIISVILSSDKMSNVCSFFYCIHLCNFRKNYQYTIIVVK